MTHNYVGYLAKRLVLEVPRMFMLSLSEVDEDQFVGDVALFGYHRHAARVRGIL